MGEKAGRWLYPRGTFLGVKSFVIPERICESESLRWGLRVNYA